MNYEKGFPMARILQRKLDKKLLYDNGEPELDFSDDEVVERFGNKKPMLSLTEKLMGLSEQEFEDALTLDPSLKIYLKNELENHKVPNGFLPNNGVVHIPGSRFIPTFNPKDFRDIIYIYGPSGAGKSALCRSYMKEYKREFPYNDIFMYSLKPSDQTLDDIEFTRVNPVMDVLTAIDFTTMENSLVIFDDCDGYGKCESPEEKEIHRIRDGVCKLGRDRRVNCIITTHIACDGDRTKIVLNELTKIVSFPRRVPKRNFDYLMRDYGGIEPKQINEIWKIPSRWVLVNKDSPSYVMYEEGCKLLQ